jgi:hypothetical protein
MSTKQLTPLELAKFRRGALGGSGAPTTIVGVTGTKAQFNAALTDGDFLFVGDIITGGTFTLDDGSSSTTPTFSFDDGSS